MDTMTNLVSSTVANYGTEWIKAMTITLVTLSTATMLALVCLYAGAGIMKRVR